MDSQNIKLSSTQVKLPSIAELCCDFCGFVRSRRGALSSDVMNRNRFICAACCERAGASSYDDVYGRADWSPRDLIGGAA